MVALAQGLLHLLLARGVDALANDANLAHLQSADALGTGHAEPVARRGLARLAVGEKGALARDVCGRGAAAATHDRDAQVKHLGHGLAVLGRMDVEDRLAVHDARQARVGLDHHGALGPGNHALYQRQEVVGAQRAVDAHGIGAHRREGDRGHLGRGAQEGAAVLGKGHGHKDGQIGVLLHGEKGGLGLGQVCHGLDDKEIGAGRGCRARLAGKELVGVVEGQGTHGLQELAGGANVGGHVANARLACAGNSGLEDLFDRGGVAEFLGIGAKGVSGGDVCAGGHVGGVDVGNLCRVGEAQKLGKLAGGQAALLQLGAHAAVEDQKLLAVQNALQVVVLHAQLASGQALFGPGAAEFLLAVLSHVVPLDCMGWRRTRPRLVIWTL